MIAEEREQLESAVPRRWVDLRDHVDERSRRPWLATCVMMLRAPRSDPA